MFVQVAGDNAARGPSHGVWKSCPWLQMEEDPSLGWKHWEDFLAYNPVVASNLARGTGLYTYEDTSSSILQLATEVGGVIRILLEAAANEEASITAGYSAGMGKIYSTTPRRLWFETRVRFGGITDQAAFIGLAEEACPANSLLADTTPVMTKDQVGFSVAIATPAALNAVYGDDPRSRSPDLGRRDVVQAGDVLRGAERHDALVHQRRAGWR
jgi:hypothetical protein